MPGPAGTAQERALLESIPRPDGILAGPGRPLTASQFHRRGVGTAFGGLSFDPLWNWQRPYDTALGALRLRSSQPRVDHRDRRDWITFSPPPKGEIAGTEGLVRGMDAQAVANSLGTLSKWTDTTVCREAAERLAGRLANDADSVKAMSPQAVANSFSALSKWPDSKVCRHAAECLAGRLASDADW